MAYLSSYKREGSLHETRSSREGTKWWLRVPIPISLYHPSTHFVLWSLFFSCSDIKLSSEQRKSLLLETRFSSWLSFVCHAIWRHIFYGKNYLCLKPNATNESICINCQHFISVSLTLYFNQSEYCVLEVAELLIYCLQKNALDDLVMSKAFPLRPGVEEWVIWFCCDLSWHVICSRLFFSSEFLATLVLQSLPS